MAIKVSGTEVVSNSRELKNISSVDATTTSTLNSTLNPNPNRGTLTKSFANAEVATITLDSAVNTAPVVTVTKEVPQPGLSNGDWDVATDGSNYDIEDFAYSADLTVDNSAKTLTLSTGSWASDDVGKRVVGNSGEVVIISVASSVATYDDSTGTNFPNNNSITSGNWNLFSLDFAASGVTFSEGQTLGALTPAVNYVFNNSPIYKGGGTNVSTLTGVALTFPQGITFNNDGTKMYIASNYPNVYIYEFDLSTAYAPSTATYNNVYLDVSSQGSTPTRIQFKPDGTQLFLFDTGNDYIFSYTLSTAWDVSSATYDNKSKSLGALTNCFIIKSDGTKMLLGERNSTTTRLEEWSFGTAWDVTTLSNTGRYEDFATDLSNGDILDMALSPNESMLTIMDGVRKFYTYTLGRYWNMSTSPRTLDGSPFNAAYDVGGVNGFAYSGDGNSLIVCEHNTTSLKEFYTPAPFSVINGACPLPYKAVTLYDRHPDLTNSNQTWAIEINDDGTKLYQLSLSEDKIFEFDLSTASDINTLSYNGVFYNTASDGATSPGGLKFKPDGTKLYVTCSSTDLVYQYSLSTAYDLSTISFDSVTFSISSQNSVPAGIHFKPDGTKMYIHGTDVDTIFQYSLSTAWDISTASYDSISLSVNSQDSSPRGLEFSPDGTKMFHGGLSTGNYYAYSLSTAWDISTATYFDTMDFPPDLSAAGFRFNNDGTKIFSSAGSRSHIIELKTYSPYSISRYTGNSYDVTSVSASATGFEFSNDGTKLYVMDYADNDSLEQHSLSTAYDLSTASYDSVDYNFYSQDTLPFAFTFKPDGTKLYMAGTSTDTAYQYSLSTAWDISTVSYDNKSFYLGTQDASPYDIKFKPDGTKMYFLGASGDRVYQYSLSTAWDISTASYDSVNFYFGTQDLNPNGFNFSPDGTRLFMAGISNDGIFSYFLNTAWDVSTAVYQNSYSTLSIPGGNNPYTLEFNNDGSKAYILITAPDKIIYEFDSTMGAAQPTVSVVPLSQYAAAVTNSSGQIDSKYWADINSMTVSETLNSAYAYYALANDGSTFKVNHDTNGLRSIVRDNAGTWQYNSNATYASETWTNATRNSVHGALEDAMSVAANQMDSTQLEAISDANHFTLDNTLDLAIMLYTTDVNNNPISDGVDINYDANALNQGAIVGTDYDFDFPDSTTVRITSNAAQNLKIRVV